MKLHWVRPNDVHITACGIHSAMVSEAADFYAVAGMVSPQDRCRTCERINETELPK